MAKLFISEFSRQGRDIDGHLIPAVPLPERTAQTVAIASTSAQSAALDVGTGMVRLCADVTCSIAVGTNPTATADSLRLAANVPEYFSVQPGQSLKIAVISNT
jgi:hypothetical protein